MIDGPHLFLDGKHAYSRVGDFTANVCIADHITLEGWQRYLDGTYALSTQAGSQPTVSVAWFTEQAPDANIRKASADFIRARNIPDFKRIALLTESSIARGAMTAFGWLMRKSLLRPFKPSEYREAIDWLREGATFDVSEAKRTFADICESFGLSDRIR